MLCLTRIGCGKILTIRSATAALFLWASAAAAVTCEDTVWDGISFTHCRVDASQDIRLFHSDSTGIVFGGFGAVEADHGPLAFAMNAGMYHADRQPVGLYKEQGELTAPLVLRPGPGNFGMLPNGVFCIADSGLSVVESHNYVEKDCRDATQSGPMLVINGSLHPRFIPGGSSKFIRNGVGTTDDNQSAIFVISNEPVNFDTFARFFRDHLSLDQALYFDGNVSRLYAPSHKRFDLGRPLGPIVGVLAD